MNVHLAGPLIHNLYRFTYLVQSYRLVGDRTCKDFPLRAATIWALHSTMPSGRRVKTCKRARGTKSQPNSVTSRCQAIFTLHGVGRNRMANWYENKAPDGGFRRGAAPFGRGLGNPQRNTLGRVGGARTLCLSSV